MAYGEVSSKGLAHCGGLFLLDQDSQELEGTFCQVNDTTRIGKYSVFAGFKNFRINGLWEDGWTLSFKSNRVFGSAGAQADFRHIAFSLQASGFPALTARLTAHTDDSTLYATTLLERGAPELATVRWESENENDEINLIEAQWEAEYLRKGISAGGKLAGNTFYADIEQINTSPHNTQREYFIKDSSSIWFWDAQYTHQFEQSEIGLQYVGVSAGTNIFGNTYRDSSTKRFMFLPIDATIHYGDIHWEKRMFGLQARALKADILMKQNNKRFFETLAPNRLLPVSLTQTLSFSFLQKNYLVNTDIDASAFTMGGHIAPQFHLSWNTKIVPRIDIDAYYTYNEIDIEKSSETTTFIAYKSKKERWFWMLEGFGAIAGLGLSVESKTHDARNTLSFEWSATQIIPFKTEFTKLSKKDGENESNAPLSKQDKKNSAGESSGMFSNGFATSLALRFAF